MWKIQLLAVKGINPGHTRQFGGFPQLCKRAMRDRNNLFLPVCIYEKWHNSHWHNSFVFFIIKTGRSKHWKKLEISFTESCWVAAKAWLISWMLGTSGWLGKGRHLLPKLWWYIRILWNIICSLFLWVIPANQKRTRFADLTVSYYFFSQLSL